MTISSPLVGRPFLERMAAIAEALRSEIPMPSLALRSTIDAAGELQRIFDQ